MTADRTCVNADQTHRMTLRCADVCMPRHRKEREAALQTQDRAAIEDVSLDLSRRVRAGASDITAISDALASLDVAIALARVAVSQVAYDVLQKGSRFSYTTLTPVLIMTCIATGVYAPGVVR